MEYTWINYLSTVAGFLPSTVSVTSAVLYFVHLLWCVQLSVGVFFRGSWILQMNGGCGTTTPKASWLGFPLKELSFPMFSHVFFWTWLLHWIMEAAKGPIFFWGFGLQDWGFDVCQYCPGSWDFWNFWNSWDAEGLMILMGCWRCAMTLFIMLEHLGKLNREFAKTPAQK